MGRGVYGMHTLDKGVIPVPGWCGMGWDEVRFHHLLRIVHKLKLINCLFLDFST